MLNIAQAYFGLICQHKVVDAVQEALRGLAALACQLEPLLREHSKHMVHGTKCVVVERGLGLVEATCLHLQKLAVILALANVAIQIGLFLFIYTIEVFDEST